MNNNTILHAMAISLITINGKFSYAQTGEMFSKVSSYQVKRWLDKHWDEQKELEKHITKLNIDWSKGWLMIDDSVIEKPYSTTNECVCWLYSSKNGDFIRGISLTVLLWSDGIKNIPIKFMVYEKDEYGKPIKTKNEFALESLQYALQLGIRPRKVCFDSKYSSSKLLNWLDNNNLTYYSQLASNRLFNGQQLKIRRFQPYTEQGTLKGVGHRVNVTKHCKRYYVTNATGKRITRQQIVKEYRNRWKIEVLFRNLKQLCHLEECQSYRANAQKHYIYVCLNALMLLEKQNQRSLYEAKKYFQQNFMGIKLNGNKALRQLAA